MKLHILLLVTVGGALSACGASKQSVGLGQSAPGENPIYSEAPLSAPPEFNLPAQASSAPQPQQGTLADTSPVGAQSSGEQALLQTAGASSIDPNIRKTVDQEASLDAGVSQALRDKLAFWQNSALQPSTTGATPTIKRKTKGMFDGIF